MTTKTVREAYSHEIKRVAINFVGMLLVANNQHMLLPEMLNKL